MKKAWNALIARVESFKFGKIVLQFFKFGLVGLSNTALSWITTFGVIAIVGTWMGIGDVTIGEWTIPNVAANLGNFLGFVVGVINSYCLNKRYVFKNKQEKSEKKAFAKTFICYGSTFLLSMLLMNLMLEVLQWHIVVWETDITDYVATMLRLLITIPLNFVANKLWAFKDRSKGEQQ